MQERIAKLIGEIAEGTERRFYCGKQWQRVRARVLKMDNYECQKCKAEGRYSRAEIVHHIHHLKDRPDLALSIWDDEGKRNLISICKYHHELEHPEAMRQFVRKEPPVTEERWD